MNTCFTADTHFGHKNIIKYTNRPFASGIGLMKTVKSSTADSGGGDAA